MFGDHFDLKTLQKDNSGHEDSPHKLYLNWVWFKDRFTFTEAVDLHVKVTDYTVQTYWEQAVH